LNKTLAQDKLSREGSR